MDWWIVVLVLGEFAFVGFILWVASNYKIRKSSERSEERLRILERFGSNEELSKFLASEAGDKLLANFVPKSSNQRSAIVTGVTAGLVCLFVGTAFLLLSWLEVWDDPEHFLIPGVLGCFAGAGILVSVAVSVKLLRRLDGDGG